MWNPRNLRRTFASSYTAMCIVTGKQEKGHNSMSCSKTSLLCFFNCKITDIPSLYKWNIHILVTSVNRMIPGAGWIFFLALLHYKICTCEMLLTQILSIPWYFCLLVKCYGLRKLMILNTKHILYTFCILVLTFYHTCCKRLC